MILQYIIIYLHHMYIYIVMWVYDIVLRTSGTVWMVAASCTQLNLGHRLKVHNSDGSQHTHTALCQGALSTAASLSNMTKGDKRMLPKNVTWKDCQQLYSKFGARLQRLPLMPRGELTVLRQSFKGIETTRNKIWKDHIHHHTPKAILAQRNYIQMCERVHAQMNLVESKWRKERTQEHDHAAWTMLLSGQNAWDLG